MNPVIEMYLYHAPPSDKLHSPCRIRVQETPLYSYTLTSASWPMISPTLNPQTMAFDSERTAKHRLRLELTRKDQGHHLYRAVHLI